MRNRHVPGPPAVLRGRRVLVVEDEALVAMMVEYGLGDAGAEVIGPAASVDEALSLIDRAQRDGGLDAAVLDLNLRGVAVSPVADRLADLGVPFVLSTGYGRNCDRGAHQAAPVLTKPFDPSALVAAVESLVAGRRAPVGPMSPVLVPRWPSAIRR